MSNIIIKPYEDSKGVQYKTIIRNERLQDYVEQSAKAFPDWKFVGETGGSNYYRNKDEHGNEELIFYVVKFDVLGKNGDYLGEMYIQSWGATPYVIDNERIRMLRERGSGIKSSEVGKIIKQMKKYFTDLTLPEKISKHFTKGEWAVDGVHRHRHRAVRNAVESIGNYVEHSLKSDFDRVNPILFMMLPEDKRDLMATIPSAMAAEAEIMDLSRAYANESHSRRASFVMIEDGKYFFVRREDKKNIIVRTSEELSPSVRQAIGMLKLLPDDVEEEDAFIPNMGVRVGKDLFVVYDDLPTKEKEGE